MNRGARTLLVFVGLSVGPCAHLHAQCPDGTPPPCAGARPAPSPLVAVLLFENRTRDSAEAYLASGLTDELIRLLQRTPGLRAASRFQAQRFGTGAGRNPATIAQALGATYLVTGSVQKEGRDVRVGVELTRGPGFTAIWSERFDRRADRLQALQDEVALAVAREVLGRVLSPGTRAAAPRGPSVAAEAYDRFLRGNYDLDRRATARAIANYRRAIDLAPGFGRAYARDAYAHANLLDIGPVDSLSRDSVLARGLASAERARRLAPDESDTWMADGYLRMFRYPHSFEGAAASFERAIALDSTNAEAHHQYAWMLSVLGQDSAAEAEYRRALMIDPERWITMWGLGRVYHVNGRFREAIQWYDSARALNREAAVSWRTRAILSLRDTAAGRAAVAAFQAENVGAGRPRTRYMELVFEVLLGDSVAARATLDTLLALPRTPTVRLVFASNVAMALVVAGERDLAIDLIERIRPRSLLVAYILRFPEFAPLRDDPRFRRVVAESRGVVP